MARITLTDRFIKSREKAPAGTRPEFLDLVVPGVALRITDKGRRTFVLIARYPTKPKHPTRRMLGTYDQMSLDDAREKARGWLKLISRGIDPAVEEEREKRVALVQAQFTVKAVVEDFIREKLPSERRGDEVARGLRRDLLSTLGDRPIADVERRDIRGLIAEKKRTAPAQARNLLTDIKRLFSWALEVDSYGLASSPCADLKASKIIGDKPTRDRVLSDDEIFALWRAASRFSYPYKQVYQLLLLNGLRLNEVVDASKREIEFHSRRWTVSKERMKSRSAKARPHVVPLTAASLVVLESLPKLPNGSYLFSFSGGESPAWVGDKVKKRLDERMLRTLKALARKRVEAASQVSLEPFTNHDIRRSVRTNLSALKNEKGVPIAEEVKEAILAHVPPGIKGTYDKFQYLDEKREALELWAGRLEEIVGAPPPAQQASDNIVPLRAHQVAG